MRTMKRLFLMIKRSSVLLALVFLTSMVYGQDDYLLVPRTETDSGYQYKASPADWRDVNIYQLFTDRFFDGDSGNNTTSELGLDRSGWDVGSRSWPEQKNYHHGGDWVGLRQKLDYIEGMGVNALWISGVQMNAQGKDTRFTPYHMYHPTDFWRCDPVSGTFQELKDLVDDCHSRGIYVILDVVINHMADLAGLPNGEDDKGYWANGNETYTWWNGANHHRGAFDRLDWFHHNGTINCWDCSPENLLGQFKGTDDLATEREDVQNELDLAFKNLIAATDCDGFRVDAIKHVEYNWCKKWADDMRKYAASLGKSDFIMFGELFVYDNNALASYCKDDGYSFNSALFFPMANTIKSVFKDSGGTGQLTSQRNNISAYGEGADRLVAFIDNHDVNRIALEMGGDYNDDVAKLMPAMTFLYTAMPVPLLYYGTEFCFDQGGHYNMEYGAEDGDHQRECMFDRGFQPGPANGNKFDAARPALYNHISAINNARKNYKSLTRGSFSERWQEGSAGAYAYSRSFNDEESLVAFNTSYDSRSISPNVDAADGTVFVNVLNESETVTSSGGSLSFSLNGKESKIFVAGAGSSLSINRTYNWPPVGEWDVGEGLWINVEAAPKSSTTNAFVVYSIDAGTTWLNVAMTIDETITAYDGWHVNLGDFPSGTELQYAVCVQDDSTEVWGNNEGNNYFVNVNAGNASVVDWTPDAPDRCAGTVIDVTYTQNDGVLAGASAISMAYGFFYEASESWAGSEMTFDGSDWNASITLPDGCVSVQICFNDGDSTWDNNSGSNWEIALGECNNDDSDGDSIPDEWENKYGFNASSPADADLDSDGDGESNRREYIAGTDPTNAASMLALDHIVNSAGAVRLTWPVADTGRRYTLYRTTNLLDGVFEVVQSNIVGSAPAVQFTDSFSTNQSAVFYKIRAEVPADMVNENVSVSASPAGGAFSDPESDGVVITLSVSGVNVASATYTIQGGTAVPYTNGTTIAFGADMDVGDYRSLTLNGATSGGVTDQEVYSFNETDSAVPVNYTGGVMTDPASGEWDEGETVTISLETGPIGAASTVGIVYTTDGGSTWGAGGLTKSGSNSSNDLWSVVMPSQAKGVALEFALVVADRDGTETWENNGSANYSIRVNSDFIPGPDKPYSTNPTLGSYRSAGITIDGDNTGGEWTDSMLIALDVANDDPRTLGDNWTTHEAPLDFTHLWACWDDNNLYIAWQMVDVTDVIDGSNAGSGDSISRNDGILVWMMLDTESGGCTNDMWGKTQSWAGDDQPDYQIYMAGSLWQSYISHQSGGVFPVDEGEYYTCADRGISIDNGALLVANELWGVRDCDNRFDGGSLENFKLTGHSNTSRDSFYEMKIPLASIGLSRAQLESSGIGVMLGAGSASAMDTIPNDNATTDTPGVETYNSSFEWGDTDNYTAPFARIAAP